MTDNSNRFTGKAWPVALRREWDIRDSPSRKKNNRDDVDQQEFSPSHQLRQYIRRSYSTISSLQRQIYRGEELYFEESYAHGNLFSGFDNIWVEAGATSDTGSSSGQGGDVLIPKSAPMRKMPNDHRWFSSSCNINPIGDARVDVILARPSLTESPQSLSAIIKPSYTESSGPVLNQSTFIDSSPVTKSVQVVTGLDAEPVTKKSKILANVNTDADVSNKSAEANATVTYRVEKDGVNTSLVDNTTSITVKTDVTVSLKALNPKAPETMVSSAIVGRSDSLLQSKANAVDQDEIAKMEAVDSACYMEVDPALASKTIPIIACDKIVTSDELPPAVNNDKGEALRSENNTRAEVNDGDECKIEVETIQSPETQTNVSFPNDPKNHNHSLSVPPRTTPNKPASQSTSETITSTTLSKTDGEYKSKLNTTNKNPDAPCLITNKTERLTPSLSNHNSTIIDNTLQTDKASNIFEDTRNLDASKISLTISTDNHEAKSSTSDRIVQDASDSFLTNKVETTATVENNAPAENFVAETDSEIINHKVNIDASETNPTSDSDSEEDVTLSELVVKKVKNTKTGSVEKASSGRKSEGTRTSRRRRKPAR